MSNKIITSAISAILAIAAMAHSTQILAEATQNQSNQNVENMMPKVDGMEQCYGIAKAGMNDCGATTHSCAGQAKTDGDKNSWMMTPTGLCSKIVSGTTKPMG